MAEVTNNTNGIITRVIVEKGEQGERGTDGVSVESIEQTTTSSESEGTNVITATLSDGTTRTFNIKNGAKGAKGDTGNPGASPIAVSSTSDMTDTTKIYVLTTDGHWYYYDGDSWEDGGIYQSTGIDPDDPNLINMVRGATYINDSNVSDYSDLKLLTNNRVYLYYVNPSSISNAPSDLGTVNSKNLFMVYKLAHTYNITNYIMYIVDMSQTTNSVANCNNMYVVSNSAVTSSFSWKKIAKEENAITKINYIMTTNVTDTNKDLNNAQLNSIIAYYLQGNQFLNAPIDMTSSNYYYLVLMTYGWNDYFKIQTCIDLIGNNKFYYRSFNANTNNWSNWICLNDTNTTKIDDFMDYSYLTSVIQEPLDITNKTLSFAGDSITAGNFIGSTNVWAKWLSDKLETTYNNLAVGGATFASVSGLTQIITQLQNAATLNPVLFIAGGTNDYSQNVSTSDFTTAVTAVCEWLTANYNGDVIFVTPINRTTFPNTTTSLDWYREEITRIALSYGYSVIDGKSIPFPTKTGSMATYMYYDGLHPSVAGQKVYANNVYQILK